MIIPLCAGLCLARTVQTLDPLWAVATALFALALALTVGQSGKGGRGE